MADRYFVDRPITGNVVTLSGAEAHHLLHVMRARAGTEITLFDGSGAEFTGRVETTARDRLELSIVERREVDRESNVPLTLGVALPKGDRQRWLVEKAVELGVAHFMAIDTTRSVVRPNDGTIDRLRRTVIEASKQCGRNRLMGVSLATWPVFLRDAPAVAVRLIAHPMGVGNRTSSPIGVQSSVSGRPNIWTAVGPEGGFTDAEVAMAIELGWQPLDLGARILRIETAALAIATLASFGLLVSRE
jgi:16S rRNA (uracil1498-N3)-methyltransferase